MGFFDRLRAAVGARRISGVQLMQEQGTRYMAWNGKVYESDIVRACLRPKVKAVGKLVGKHIRESVLPDGSRSIAVNPAPGIRRLLEEPNPLMTGQVLQEKLATQLCLNNNAFALIMRDDMGLPVAIYPLLPQTVEAIWSADGTLALRMQMPNSKIFTFDYRDILHLRQDFNEDDIFGTPVAPALAPLLNVVTTTDQGIVNAIKNSSVVRWLLKFTNSLKPSDLKKQAQDFADTFLATSGGTGVAAVDSKAEALQIDPKDYVPNAEQMDRTTLRIFALFNTNANIVNSSRSEDEWEAYFDAEVEPVLRQLGGEYTRKLFTLRERGFGNRIVFEASSWDGASLTTKLNLMQMVDRGALTPNEWRLAFNLAPVPGGDVPIRRLDTAEVRRANRVKINIMGAIVPNDDAWVYEYLDMQCCSPAMVADALAEAAGQNVDVYINSGGGDIFAGSEIYAALRAYTGQLRLHVVGLAGSAASVIACAGWCDMSPTAMMMVHNVSAGASGDYHDMERCAETLKKANAAMAAAYVAKTGMSEADALAMMDKETWMTAQDALDKKLVDAIAEPAPTALSMTAAAEGCLLSAETVERIRNTVKSPAARKLAAEIEILKLKGETV